MTTIHNSKLFEDTALLTESLTDLKNDIGKVDSKLSDLDQLLLDLKNGLNRAQQMLHNAAPQDKVNLYKVINATMETMATYYQVYTKFMELKFRYRAECSEMSFKSIRLIQIELKKLDGRSDASYMDMVELLKKLAGTSSRNNGEDSSNVPPSGMSADIQAEIKSLDNDDIYRTD